MSLSLLEHWKRLFRPSSGLSVERAKQVIHWKNALIEEHAELGQELNELLEAYERSLTCFAEHAVALDEASFQRERQSLEAIRQTLANAVRRLELSTKDNQELVNEWNEWQARRTFADQDVLQDIQRVRTEMLRSELMVRGLKQDKEERIPSQEEEAEERIHPVPASSSRLEPDHLDDWQEKWLEHIEPLNEYWTGEVKRLADEHHPESWPEIIRQFRAAQAALKIHDRQKGIRRDRLAVFER